MINGFYFEFDNKHYSLFQNSNILGSDFLDDALYWLILTHAKTSLILQDNIETEHSAMNVKSSFLWNKRLDNVSSVRMKGLVMENIILNLDFPTFRNVWIE